MMGKKKTGEENDSRQSFLETKKKYKKSFLKNALLLCVYQIKHSILNSIANLIFSGENQKPTKFLRFVNRSLNKNLCKCRITAEKCEYYKQTLEKIQNFG